MNPPVQCTLLLRFGWFAPQRTINSSRRWSMNPPVQCTLLIRFGWFAPQRTINSSVKNVVGLSQLFSSMYSAKFHVSLNFL